MTATDVSPIGPTWAEASQAYLRAELNRVRLLFRRRIRWLRRGWEHDQLAHSRIPVISDALVDRLLAGTDAEEEARYYNEDPECAALGRQLAQIDEDLARERGSLPDGGSVPALAILTRSFGLGSLDRDILLLCIAAEDDAGFGTLCGYAQDEVHARYPTLDLATALFCTGREPGAARAALLPGAPLRRFHLITLGDAAGTPQCLRPLQVDSRIADYARGFNRLDERLVPVLRPISASLLVGTHHDVVEGLVRWATALSEGEPWPAFNLAGARGAGKRAVARGFCARLGLTLYAIDPRRVSANDVDRQQLLQVLLEREAVLSRSAVYVDVSDVDVADRAALASLRDWLERLSAPVFVGSRDRWRFDRHAMHIAVPRLDLAARRSLWRHALESAGARVDEPEQIDRIVQQFDLGPGAIPEAVHIALAQTRRREPGAAAAFSTELWRACREQVAWVLSDLAQRLEPVFTFDDIVLPDDGLRQLKEIADQVRVRSRVYEEWGFGRRLGRGRGISALFAGPSGTGKTMAAEILAKHLQLDLYRIDLAGVVSKYIGETEKNLRNVFDAAEQTGAILLFDEADALFGKRTEVKDSHDRYANIEVNYLLQRMEDYRGLAILCTNRRSALDRAFLRRLRFLIEFPLPDGDHRRRIWQKVFPPEAAVDQIDWDALSRLEITGGNIRNIAVNAAFLAAGCGTPIRMEHLLHAARREYSKVDKLPTEAEFGRQFQRWTV